MSFKNKLFSIRESVQNHSSISLYNLVDERLSKTLDLYVRQLENSYNNILRKDELKVLQQLNRRGA